MRYRRCTEIAEVKDEVQCLVRCRTSSCRQVATIVQPIARLLNLSLNLNNSVFLFGAKFLPLHFPFPPVKVEIPSAPFDLSTLKINGFRPREHLCGVQRL